MAVLLQLAASRIIWKTSGCISSHQAPPFSHGCVCHFWRQKLTISPSACVMDISVHTVTSGDATFISVRQCELCWGNYGKISWLTNNSKQMEKNRELHHAFIVHCPWVTQQLCQDCYKGCCCFVFLNNVSFWMKLKVKMKRSMYSMSSGICTTDLSGDRCKTSASYDSSSHCLNVLCFPTAAPHLHDLMALFHNMARIWIELHWLRMFVCSFSFSTAVPVNV